MPQIITAQSVARPAYFDRDPIPILLGASGTFAPHVFVVRASYTPPYLYACFIEQFYCSVQRTSAAGSVFRAYSCIQFVSFYGPTGFGALVKVTDNVINHWENANIPGYGYMAYGDTIQLCTANDDTGGAVSHNISMKGTEFLY